MSARYGPRNGRFTKANASRLGKLGVAARARKRIECQREPELRKLPARSPRYTLILRDDNTGQIREWAILQGPRANNLIICAQGKEIIGGWDKLFSSLSARLSEPVRVFV